MIALVSTINMVLGAAVAFIANSYPPHREIIETVAGIVLIGGFAMLGYALECVLDVPSNRRAEKNLAHFFPE
jgi:cytochrome c biogenesis protein CcdA